MYLITQLLLPYLDVDSMAALLETCKEAHSAFHPVEIDSRPCHNRGLAERLGQKSVHFESYQWQTVGQLCIKIRDSAPDWIKASGPAFFALLLKQYPEIEQIIQSKVEEHCSHWRNCIEDLEFVSVFLDPKEKCFDEQYFYFKVGCACICTKKTCWINCLDIKLKR